MNVKQIISNNVMCKTSPRKHTRKMNYGNDVEHNSGVYK